LGKLREKLSKFYFSSSDWLNLVYICLLLIFIIQATVHLFIIKIIAFKIANICTVVLFVLAAFFSVKTVKSTAKFEKEAELSIEDAKMIAERYIREHKLSRKQDEIELCKVMKLFISEHKDVQVRIGKTLDIVDTMNDEDKEDV